MSDEMTEESIDETAETAAGEAAEVAETATEEAAEEAAEAASVEDAAEEGVESAADDAVEDAAEKATEKTDDTSAGEGTAKRSKTPIIIACVAAVVIVVAIIAFCVFGKGSSSSVAATVNGTAISEDRVTEWIQTYRTNYQLTDDDEFAEFLDYYGTTAEGFRENAIQELAIRDLVQKRADELGITVSDEEVQAYYDSIVGDNDTSEGSMWAQVLASAGLTEDILKERYRYNIMQNKVFANDVEYRTATDDETFSYIKYNLVGTTQMKVSHIVISGDNAEARANECYQKLTEAKANGTLTSDVFSSLAKQYSNEDGVATTGGLVGWSGSGNLSSAVLDALEGTDSETVDPFAAGDLTGLLKDSPESGSYEIAYIVETYTFPSEIADDATLASLGVPSDLLEVVRANVAMLNYKEDCSTYLSDMLAAATVTINPMPTSVPYNVKTSA